jgi:pSer/pThr/pTyr-binding forkhead associated (FHA) protein
LAHAIVSPGGVYVPALIVKSGPDAGKRFEINSQVVVVGRGDVDCVIDDAELSRKHVTVRATAAGVEVEDLGSLNGTWFNGKRLEEPTVIPDGGVIRLGGKIELMIEAAKAAVDESRTVVAPVVAPSPAAEDAPPTPVEEPPTAVAAPPTAVEPAAAAPAPPEPEVVSEGPPPTNIPVKARTPSKPAPEPTPPAAPDASTVPPRRRAAPPPPPSKSRRGAVPAGVGAAASSPLGAFAPPAKAGRRTVATRLVVPAFLTFLVIFATAIALIIYFAAQ